MRLRRIAHSLLDLVPHPPKCYKPALACEPGTFIKVKLGETPLPAPSPATHAVAHKRERLERVHVKQRAPLWIMQAIISHQAEPPVHKYV